MPIFTTAFGISTAVGVSMLGWRLLNSRPQWQPKIVLQVQQSFRAASLGLQGGGDWPVEKVQRITSGKGEGLLQGWKLIMRYPAGKNLYDVQNKLDKIAEWLESDMKAQGVGNRLYLTIYDTKAMTVVPYTKKIVKECSGSWKVPVGLAEKGWIYHDFDLTPHFLIGGATNMGKTNYLFSLVYTLFRAHTASEMQLYIVDMKRGISFRFMYDTPYVAAMTDGKAELHIERLNEALELVEKVVTEMHSTYEQLDEWGVTDWKEAKERGHTITHRFLIIDECAEMRGNDKESKLVSERIWSTIASITQLGRAVGIHVILSTQRPEVDVVPGLVKANLDARLAFRLPDSASSMTILGRGGAEHLPPIKGRGLYLTHELQMIQTPKVDIDSIRLRASLLIKSRSKGTTSLPAEPFSTEWEEGT